MYDGCVRVQVVRVLWLSLHGLGLEDFGPVEGSLFGGYTGLAFGFAIGA